MTPIPAAPVRRSPTGGVIVQQRSAVRFTTRLTFEELLYPLLCGLQGVAAPTAQAGTPAPQLWTFAPNLAGAGEPATATFEFGISDGTAQLYEREAGYGICTNFEIGMAEGAIATLDTTWAARASQAATLTPSLTPIPGRTPVPSGRFSAYLDDSWAALGTTRIPSRMRTGNVSVTPGVVPAEGFSGRADLDYQGVESGDFAATASLGFDYNAAATAEFAHQRAGDKRFLRLQAIDGDRMVTIDMCGILREVPTLGESGRVDTSTLALTAEADAAGTFRVALQNFVAARP